MDSFKNLMAEIEEEQFLMFQSLIENKMNKKFYLCIYLGSFLGNNFFPMSKKDFNKIKNITEQEFCAYCHKMISKVSLCAEEIDFFHQMADINDKENYINKCIETYHKIDNLKNCQLGTNILKCLNASKNINIY